MPLTSVDREWVHWVSASVLPGWSLDCKHLLLSASVLTVKSHVTRACHFFVVMFGCLNYMSWWPHNLLFQHAMAKKALLVYQHCVFGRVVDVQLAWLRLVLLCYDECVRQEGCLQSTFQMDEV